MRYAIISDIHGNLTAFRAVLDDITRQGKVEKLWCLGDIVGYGPEPHECIRLLQETNHVSVIGNHDLAAIGKLDLATFNSDAAVSCRWTTRQLNPSDAYYLSNLPLSIREEDFTMVHGSPREPVWEYVVSTSLAKENFAYFETPACLVGHSHVPLVFSHSARSSNYSSRQFETKSKLVVGKDRLIVNCGSVGQPRDGDPRAAYGIYDSKTRRISLHRVTYDIHATQDKMVAYGLPMRLVARLSYGM